MRAEGATTFDAPRETVWRVLIHPQSIAQTMPGVEHVSVQDDDHWTVHAKLPLGLIRPRMTVACELVERREPEFAQLLARGESVAGKLRMTTSFELADAADATTSMQWRADVDLSGRIASVGARVIEPLVERQVKRVMESLKQQVHAEAA